MTDDNTTAIIRAWTDDLARELGVDPAVVDIDGVLALAGVVAHAVVRPAAPLSTYLAGYAAGLAAGSGGETTFASVADAVRALAARQ